MNARRHRGFAIDVHRSRSLGGDEVTYYSVFRVRDRREMTSGFTCGEDSPDYLAQLFAERVDEFLRAPMRRRRDDNF
jgi:hypothetical protein